MWEKISYQNSSFGRWPASHFNRCFSYTVRKDSNVLIVISNFEIEIITLCSKLRPDVRNIKFWENFFPCCSVFQLKYSKYQNFKCCLYVTFKEIRQKAKHLKYFKKRNFKMAMPDSQAFKALINQVCKFENRFFSTVISIQNLPAHFCCRKSYVNYPNYTLLHLEEKR